MARPKKKLTQLEYDSEMLWLDQREALVREQMEKLLAADPFWAYKPSDGAIGDREREFLSRWLEPEDIPQRLDGQRDSLLCDAEIILTAGGNQCLGGETEIFNPVKNEFTPISRVERDFAVLSLGKKGIEGRDARRPFKKAEDDIYRIGLSNGESFTASMGHLVLTPFGYNTIFDVLRHSLPVLRGSIGESGFSIHFSGDRSCGRKAPGFQGDCLSCPRFCGERLPQASNNGLSGLPSQGGVPGHTARDDGQMDGRVNKSGCIRQRQHGFRPSSQDDRPRCGGRAFDSLFPLSRKSWKSSYRSYQRVPQPPDVSSRLLLPTGESFRRAKSCFPPCSYVDVTSVIYLRKDVKWDFEVPGTHNYLAAGIIHHNSGKTTRSVLEDYIDITKELPLALENIYPREKIPAKSPFHVRVVGVDHKTMLNNILPNYQYWAPRDYLKNGKWSDSFSAERNAVTLYKPGSPDILGTIEFMTNQQDVESFQGPARDKVNYDEEPRQDIYKENLMRFVTAEKLRIRLNMTPTRGMSWVKDEILDRAATEAGNSIRAFKLASVTNPMANLAVLEEALRGMGSYEEIKMRLLGEFVSLSGLVYGRLFSRQVHVISPFPLDPYQHMVVRGIDPHLVKPTVCVELAVDSQGNEYLVGTYSRDADTEEIKRDLAARATDRGYRLGWAMCDKSADSTLKVLGDRNIFRELSRGNNAVPALFTSEKFTGSINAGVDEIKQLLKVDEHTGKPRLFIFDIPENKTLINAFETLERDISANEDRKGIRDKINEGKHDTHAALRYIHQRVVRWVPPMEKVPEYEPVNEVVGY